MQVEVRVCSLWYKVYDLSPEGIDLEADNGFHNVYGMLVVM